MHIEALEKRWIQISVLTLVLFAVLIGVAAFSWGVQVPTLARRVHPEQVKNDPRWGTIEVVEPGQYYRVYMVAKTWEFKPREIQIPAGAKVTFYVTSLDVQHGFKIVGTNVSIQVIPGYVGKLSHTFQNPGEYAFVCSEYCGIAHAVMFGKIIVTPAQQQAGR